MDMESLTRTLITWLPDRAALPLVTALATRTRRPVPTPDQQQAMAKAVRLACGVRKTHAAWSWGSGPLVILVHGWNGGAAQMAPLAQSLADRGFRCVAIDIRGHGASPGKRTAWGWFIEDIGTLSRALGQDVYAYVAHSAGGLTTMAARRLQGIRAARYVCLSAPAHPYPPIRIIQKRLSPRATLLDRYRQYIAAQFRTDWDSLVRGQAYAGAGAGLLLIHDGGDRMVDHQDADRIQAWCPGARVIKTEGLGHLKILAAPGVARAVGDFLSAGSPAHPAQAERMNQA